MRKTRKHSATYPTQPTVPAHMREFEHHSKANLEAEIKAFTAGPNIPTFFPDFAISLATSISRHGSLSGPQVMKYMEVHENLVAQGYMTCPNCLNITPKEQ